MFPRTVQRFTSAGGDTPVTKSVPSAIVFRTLKDVLPSSDIETFPGPLLMDNNKGGIKTKRKELTKYLDEHINIYEAKFRSFSVMTLIKEKPRSFCSYLEFTEDNA